MFRGVVFRGLEVQGFRACFGFPKGPSNGIVQLSIDFWGPNNQQYQKPTDPLGFKALNPKPVQGFRIS